MKLYRLPIVLHAPGEHVEDQFMAEVATLPGCRAWGDTAAEALENLQSVATAFLESYKERGDPLPSEVEAAGSDMGTQALSEVLVAL